MIDMPKPPRYVCKVPQFVPFNAARVLTATMEILRCDQNDRLPRRDFEKALPGFRGHSIIRLSL